MREKIGKRPGLFATLTLLLVFLTAYTGLSLWSESRKNALLEEMKRQGSPVSLEEILVVPKNIPNEQNGLFYYDRALRRIKPAPAEDSALRKDPAAKKIFYDRNSEKTRYEIFLSCKEENPEELSQWLELYERVSPLISQGNAQSHFIREESNIIPNPANCRAILYAYHIKAYDELSEKRWESAYQIMAESLELSQNYIKDQRFSDDDIMHHLSEACRIWLTVPCMYNLEAALRATPPEERQAALIVKPLLERAISTPERRKKHFEAGLLMDLPKCDVLFERNLSDESRRYLSLLEESGYCGEEAIRNFMDIRETVKEQKCFLPRTGRNILKILMLHHHRIRIRQLEAGKMGFLISPASWEARYYPLFDKFFIGETLDNTSNTETQNLWTEASNLRIETCLELLPPDKKQP